MALSHNRLSPGVEFYEFDRSQYGQKRDYSLVDTTTLVCGFSNKGIDTVPKWINTIQNFEQEFGVPTNEVERYFYNGVNETLQRGGVALAVKLPYANDYYDKYSYVEYDVVFDSGDKPFQFKGLTADQVMSADATITSYFKIQPVSRGVNLSVDIWYPRDFKDALRQIAAAINCDMPKIEDTVDIYEGLMKFMKEVDAAEVVSAHSETYDDNYKECKRTVYDFIDWLNANWRYSSGAGYIGRDEYDRLCTSSRFIQKNKIRFVDITRSKYGSARIKQKLVRGEPQFSVADTPCLGYMPVVTTAVNAMYFRDLITVQETYEDGDRGSAGIDYYSPVHDFQSVRSRGAYNFKDMYQVPFKALHKAGDSVSKRAADFFPSIVYTSDQRLSRDNLKKIGVVVFQVTSDEADDSKLQFTPVEAFSGSLDRRATDPVTHASQFIDDVVNAGSRYINMFSNVQTNTEGYAQASTIVVEDQIACVLGFYHDDENEKTIDYTNSIIKPLSLVFDKLKDMNQLRIDLVVDAGVSNIAQFVKWLGDGGEKAEEEPGGQETKPSGEFNGDMYPFGSDGLIWTFDKDRLAAWRAVVQKFDDFCKNMRRDCMFLADGPRTLVLEGDVKLVRDSQPQRTIANSIVPNVKYISGVNSSYSAGYCNWFKQRDAYSKDFFWCPPSIKAAGVYIYTDAYFKPWDAPAGLRRGTLGDVFDTSFDPRNDEAGRIYQQAWNYATNFPLEGIVLEGQRTFQLQETSLDRVDVRRLMLYLERNIVQMGRRFLYEGNTAALRQQYADLVDVLLKDAQTRDGIRDYAIKCDSSINTDETIDRHELHMVVGIKPVKTIEWIRLNFIVTNQSANVTEEVLR